MTPFFVKCTVPSVRYREHTILNNPVNMSLCSELGKGKLAYYPDNVGLPTIQFLGTGNEHTTQSQWTFESEAQRDIAIDSILRICNVHHKT